MKILVVEDEPSLCEVLSKTLENEGHVVEKAMSRSEAQDKLAGYRYDCILLDVMLPDGNGLDLLRELKQANRRENVIVVSAKDSLEDKVAGLDYGADDYLSKPFHLAELSARIKSVARRSQGGGMRGFSLGNVYLDPESFRLWVDGKEIALLKKEFNILSYFMQRPNHVIDKSVLAESVWGDHADQSDDFHYVYAQMKNLRRKLVGSGASVEIVSIYGFGYKLVERQ